MQYGICKQTSIPIRAEASHATEMISQLIFGESYTVITISENQKWVKIITHYDSYEGWISALQHTPVTEHFIKEAKILEPVLLSNPFCYAKGEQSGKIILSMGSILPLYDDADNTFFVGSEKFMLLQPILFCYGNSREILLNNALQFLNTPYLWGGKTIFGTDCSGFVQQNYRMIGAYLPRDSRPQSQEGKEVPLQYAESGDLAFFEQNGKIDHVGIVIAGGKILHASGAVRIDMLDQKGILKEETATYTHQLAFIKQIL
jgi:hypothetical protein